MARADELVGNFTTLATESLGPGPPVLGEESPKIDYRKKKYPYSNLSTGGPFIWGSRFSLEMSVAIASTSDETKMGGAVFSRKAQCVCARFQHTFSLYRGGSHRVLMSFPGETSICSSCRPVGPGGNDRPGRCNLAHIQWLPIRTVTPTGLSWEAHAAEACVVYQVFSNWPLSGYGLVSWEGPAQDLPVDIPRCILRDGGGIWRAMRLSAWGDVSRQVSKLEASGEAPKPKGEGAG